MTFRYPLGLLGLIGIPILIVIYIIKSKYAEQTVSSTYLWTLSERFLKKRNPLSRITGIISLIFQLLAVTVLSLAIAHPVITVPNAAKEYCFVLDASGSMLISEGDSTRFDKGKDAVLDIIADAADGSLYSLVCVGDATTVIFDRIDDKDRAELLIDELRCSYVASDMTDAMGVAQRYFNENPSVKTYLVTDIAYQSHDNLTLVNIASTPENYGVSDITYTLSGGVLNVWGNATSYVSGATLTLELYIDGSIEPVASGVSVVPSQTETPFQLIAPCEEFDFFRVKIVEQDALALDNETVVYNPDSLSAYKTLIVSDTPFFLQSALASVTDISVDTLTGEEYEKAYADGSTPLSGYGLYIFDSVTPTVLPSDGAIWLFNTDSVENAGFSSRGEVDLGVGALLESTGSSGTVARKLTKDLLGKEIYITKYQKYGLYRNFTSLYSYKGDPIVFAGTNAYGNREVVFAFSLHDSNLPLLLDYAILIRNMFDYSFPDVVEEVSYYCGDTLNVNVVANCSSIRVTTPSKDVVYLATDSAISHYLLTEAGVHTLTVTVDGNERQYFVNADLPKEERSPVLLDAGFNLVGEASDEGFDGKFDALMLFVIVLAVLFFADWGVYCYERHQLQ